MANELIGLRREKFMGNAQQVQRPVLPAPAAPLPAAPGAANMMGSGSAPIGGDGNTRDSTIRSAGALDRLKTAGGVARNLATGARAAVTTGGGMVGGTLRGLLPATAAASAVGSYATPTEDFAGRMGVDMQDSSVGTQLGVRAAGTLADLGNAITFGGADRLGNLLTGNGFNRSIAPAAQNPTQSPVSAAPAAPGAPIATPAIQTAAQPEKLAGTPLFGAEGVRKVVTAGQNPLFTNATSNAQDAAFRASRGTMSVADRIDPAAAQRTSDLAKEVSLMRAGLTDRGDINAYLKGASQVASLQPGGASSELQAQIAKITRGGKNLTAAGAANVNGLITADMNNQRQQQETAERGRNAELQAQVQREQQGVAMRGQDIGERNAAATLRQRQAQDDREFGLKGEELGLKRTELGLKGAEFGAKRDSESLAQRQSFDKNLTDRYSTQFVTPDGKVDTGRVAKFKTGIQTFVGNKQAELAEKIQAGQATAEERQLADKLAKLGPAALDEEDLTRIETNIKRGERLEQTTAMVGGSKFIQSNDPNAYGLRGRKTNMFGSDTLEFNNGSTGRAADFEFTEDGNEILPNILKTRTDAFGLKARKQ